MRQVGEDQASLKLAGLEATLAQGYAIVRQAESGERVRSVAQDNLRRPPGSRA